MPPPPPPAASDPMSWTAGALAHAADLVRSAGDELSRIRPQLDALIPATDWHASAARAFHTRAAGVDTDIRTVRLDVEATASALDGMRARAALSVALP
jgi:hypothetical protein